MSTHKSPHFRHLQNYRFTYDAGPDHTPYIQQVFAGDPLQVENYFQQACALCNERGWNLWVEHIVFTGTISISRVLFTLSEWSKTA